MQRITQRVPESQVQQLDGLVESGEFPNRSEAIRHAIREMLADRGPETDQVSGLPLATDGGDRP